MYPCSCQVPAIFPVQGDESEGLSVNNVSSWKGLVAFFDAWGFSSEKRQRIASNCGKYRTECAIAMMCLQFGRPSWAPADKNGAVRVACFRTIVVPNRRAAMVE